MNALPLRTSLGLIALVAFAGCAPRSQPLTSAPASPRPVHVNYIDQAWSDDPGIPLRGVARWKTLLGSGGVFGEGLPDKDLYIRQGEMGPGAAYPEHSHASPEFWYFVSGTARWTVDGVSFDAEPGSAVYLKPGSVRSLRITSRGGAQIVRGNWGIDCKRDQMLAVLRPGTSSAAENTAKYVFLGKHGYAGYPQPDRARLPKWSHGSARQPRDGSVSNLTPPDAPDAQARLIHLNEHDVRYPEDPTGVRRWKALVGDSNANWGEGLPDKHLTFGVGELGSGGVYDDHQHAWPEFYYVLAGQLTVRVDGEEVVAQPGELIYHRPWAVHRSVVSSRGEAHVLWANWVTGCDRSVLQQPYRLHGPIPAQPKMARLPRE